MPHERRLTWALPVLLLIACTRADHDHSHSFTRITEDGVPVSISSSEPLYSGELFRYDQVLRLVGDETVPESLLNRPGAFTLDSAGTLYVADTGNDRIVKFDPDGRFLGTFGQRGEGPGDLNGPDCIWEGNGVLEVQCPSGGRVSRFRTNGTFIDEVRHAGYGTPYYGGEKTVRYFTPISSQDRNRVRAVAVISGSPPDTVSTPWVQVSADIDMVTANGRTITSSLILNYSTFPRIAHVPGRGLLAGTGLDAQLTWWDYDGVPTSRIRLDGPPERVTDEEQRFIRQRARERMELEAPDPRRLPFRFDPADVPISEFKPAWSGFEVDDAGFIWLFPPHADGMFVSMSEQPRIVRVLSPDGEYLGETELPTLWVEGIRYGRLLTLEEDPETGAAVPTVYRVVPIAPGFRYP